MKKLDLGQTVTILANIGVIAGIVFLAVELQQNTDSVRSATIQAVSERSYEAVRISIENPELREAILAVNSGEATEQQRFLTTLFYVGMLRLRQNQYLQAELGTLDGQALAELADGQIFLSPGFTEFWAQNRGLSSDGFRTYIDSEIQRLSELRRLAREAN